MTAQLDAATIKDLSALEKLLVDLESEGPIRADEVKAFRALIQEVRDGIRFRVIIEGSSEIMFLTQPEIDHLTAQLQADPLDEERLQAAQTPE